MTDYYVIGDVHGKAGMLEDLLKNLGWSNQFAFSRDLIDRGEDSRRVLEMVRELVDNHGAICLSGNHEYMFLGSITQKKVMITIVAMVVIQPLTLF